MSGMFQAENGGERAMVRALGKRQRIRTLSVNESHIQRVPRTTSTMKLVLLVSDGDRVLSTQPSPAGLTKACGQRSPFRRRSRYASPGLRESKELRRLDP